MNKKHQKAPFCEMSKSRNLRVSRFLAGTGRVGVQVLVQGSTLSIRAHSATSVAWMTRVLPQASHGLHVRKKNAIVKDHHPPPTTSPSAATDIQNQHNQNNHNHSGCSSTKTTTPPLPSQTNLLRILERSIHRSIRPSWHSRMADLDGVIQGYGMMAGNLMANSRGGFKKTLQGEFNKCTIQFIVPQSVLRR